MAGRLIRDSPQLTVDFRSTAGRPIRGRELQVWPVECRSTGVTTNGRLSVDCRSTDTGP